MISKLLTWAMIIGGSLLLIIVGSSVVGLEKTLITLAIVLGVWLVAEGVSRL